MGYEFFVGVAVAVTGIVVGNLVLHALKGNKKVSAETFEIFMENVNKELNGLSSFVNSLECRIKEMVSEKAFNIVVDQLEKRFSYIERKFEDFDKRLLRVEEKIDKLLAGQR